MDLAAMVVMVATADMVVMEVMAAMVAIKVILCQIHCYRLTSM